MPPEGPDHPLPEVRITWCGVPWFQCAVCRKPWQPPDIPCAYTVESLEAVDTHPPVPVCDECIEKRYPAEVWDELRAERRRFEQS